MENELIGLVKNAMEETTKIEQDFFHRKINITIQILKDPKYEDLLYSSEQVIEMLEALKR